MTAAEDRIAEVTRIHADALLARSDYIPLIVGTKCPGQPPREAFRQDTRAAVAQAVGALAPRVEIDSDWIPSVSIGLFQCIAIPSLLGAPLKEIAGSEPICEPCFSSLDEAIDAGTPAVEGPVIDELLTVARDACDTLPEGWRLSMPASASPWDLATLLLGEEFLVGMITEPDKARQLLVNLTDMFIELTQLTLRCIGQEHAAYITNRGIAAPGFRLPSDAMVNFSPDMLRQFLPPVLDRIGPALGPAIIHFCTTPAPSGHVLPVLTELDHVLAVDNWQKPFVFIGDDAPARLQENVAIIGDLDLSDTDKIDEFFRWEPVTDVPRKGGRGMIINAWAPDVDEGRRLYAYWRSCQNA